MPKTVEFQAVDDHVLVDRAKRATKTAGGIILPDARRSDPPPCYGRVVAVGPKVESVKTGDVVVFNDQESTTAEFGDVCLHVLREFCIFAKMDAAAAKKLGLELPK